MKLVLHFTLLIFFLIHTARGQIGGYLYFELVKYENRQDKLADGSSCNIFGGSCDPYFKICIGQGFHGCELWSYTTPIFKNRKIIIGTSDGEKLGNRFKKRVVRPLPHTVRVTITTMEHDIFRPTQDLLISVHEDVLRVNPFPNGRLFTSAMPTITMNRKDRGYNRVDMRIKVYSVCDKNVYGKDCEGYCAPSAAYICDDEGNKMCRPGPECYPGYDFCKDKPCLNGAICVSSNSSCLCNGPFYGPLCQHMHNLCRNIACENNGTCMMSSAGDKICLCLPGFQGDYCEIVIKPTTPAEPKKGQIIKVASGDSKLATAGVISNEWIWVTVGIIILILMVLFVVLAIYGRRRLLKATRSVATPQVVNEVAQDSFNTYEMPILSDPYDKSENKEEASTGNCSQPLSSNHAEYTSMKAPNENIYEEYLYEKLVPLRIIQYDPMYVVPDNICHSRNDKMSNKETQLLTDDMYDFAGPPPLPLRNLP